MLRLLRAMKEMPIPNGSVGAVITSTSMPRSASSVEQNGPGSCRERSRRRRPSSATISVHRRLEEDRPVLVVEHEGGGTGHAGTLAAGSVQDRARSTLVLEAQPRRPVAVEAEARTTHAARVEENEVRGLVGDGAHDGA